MFDWLPVAVAAVLFLGASAVYLRGSKDKGTIDTLERNNRALNEEVGILSGKLKDFEAHRAVDHERIRSQEQKIQALENVANSSELITAQTDLIRELSDLIRDVAGSVTTTNKSLTTHHGAAMAAVIQLHEDLQTLPERIGEQIRETP